MRWHIKYLDFMIVLKKTTTTIFLLTDQQKAEP